MKNKRLKIISILLTTAVLCSGCQSTKTVEKREKTHLILWHYWDIKKNQENLQNLVDDFNNSQNTIEIEITYVPD